MKRKKLIEKAPMHVKKGDKVVVISGKDKGKSGKVLTIDRDKRTVIIEGVNIIKRHQRPTAKLAKGGIIEREGPIRAEKVMVADPRTGDPDRPQQGRRQDRPRGEEVRRNDRPGVGRWSG